MKGLCKKANIDPPFGFHAPMHLMSSLLDDDPKISTKTIQKILGHASQRTTEIYLHELDGAVENAMDSISGKFTSEIQSHNQSPATTNKKGLPAKPLKALSFIWSGRLDLNQRPLVPQTSALPGCATSR